MSNGDTRWLHPAACALAVAALVAGCASRPSKQAAVPVARAAIQTPAVDKDLTAALMAGEFAWQDGRGAAAAKHFARAAALSPDSGVAEHATRVALVSRQWDLARETLARWRELDPKALGPKQAEAALALAAGDAALADRLLGELLELSEDGRKLVGQALLSAADKEPAIAALERLAADEALPGGEDALLLLAQVAQQLKRDDIALRFGDRAVARDPKSAKAYFWRGHLHVRGSDREQARRDFARAVELAPEERDYLLTYAALLNDAGDAAGAARALRRGKVDDEVLAARAAYAAHAEDAALMREVYDEIARQPEPHPDARVELLGQMAELIGLKREALEWYRKVPRGDSYLSSQLRIPVLLDDLGQRDEALAHLAGLRAAGIDDDQKLADSFLLESELMNRREDRAAAAAVFERGLKALPDDRRLLYARALLNEEMDKVEEAERDLRRIVELDPEDPDALNALGYTLADRERKLDEALKLISKALALKPDEAAIVDSMGWVQYRLGNRAEAIKHLRRAYELQPDAEIAAHLGEVLWADGNRAEAREVWAGARKKEPDNETLRETIARLER